ncbi:G-type lectin S-receptor-like serine/threonine-protein kinase [Forsythia ovata]|uniref:G-type lectin S-receptor-like serine/threonine-protein kinase n=1 Tax=Forsythia ovata TaxID=205694 RepID=A0ABD1S781_9LAMI
MDLLDASLVTPNSASEVLRCIHVGLLCVQQRQEDRPTMSNVLLMLDIQHPVVSQPKHPGFYSERSLVEATSSSTRNKPHTSNELTVALVEAREFDLRAAGLTGTATSPTSWLQKFLSSCLQGHRRLVKA